MGGVDYRHDSFFMKPFDMVSRAKCLEKHIIKLTIYTESVLVWLSGSTTFMSPSFFSRLPTELKYLPTWLQKRRLLYSHSIDRLQG